MPLGPIVAFAVIGVLWAAIAFVLAVSLRHDEQAGERPRSLIR